MTEKTWYIKLNGGETQDQIEYCNEWMEAGNLICQAFGSEWHVYAFDPDLCIADKSGYSMTLPKTIVHLLVKLLSVKEIPIKENNNVNL